MMKILKKKNKKDPFLIELEDLQKRVKHLEKVIMNRPLNHNLDKFGEPINAYNLDRRNEQ